MNIGGTCCLPIEALGSLQEFHRELIGRLLLMEKTIEKQQHHQYHQRKLSQSTAQIQVLNQKLEQREEQIRLSNR